MPNEARYGWTYSPLLTLHMPVATGTSAEEYLTDYVAGFKYYIAKVSSTVEVAGTGAAATRPFTLVRTRGTTDTTLASITIALADVATKGGVLTWTLGTDVEMLDADKLSVAVAGSGTQFTALTLNTIVLARTKPQQLQ